MPILKCTQFTVSVCMGAHFLVYVFRVDLYLCAHNQSYFLHFKRCQDFLVMILVITQLFPG